MPKRARFWIVVAVLVQALWSLPLGAFFAYRWLVLDNADAGFTCRDLTGRYTTCLEGETANMVLALVFSSVGSIMLGVAAYLAVRWIRRGRREDYLREHGVPARAVVAHARPTASRVNGNQVYRLTVQVPDVPGLEFRYRTLTPLPQGTALTVAYDPDKPDDPVILDDLRALSASLRHPRTEVDARIQRLTQLDALRASGALTEEEFDRLKDEALNQG
ncbi:hypothetical protein Aph01nite_27350 [Acrocarpospora phusangensis]|uniref:SHOCT domain-containing protein n=1 Tax=Acrocarpospora phusangensis TaxID=1070424 RepID=A0A919UQC4_9ACTN|nr:SHOCT domain-containing protein [Acrocarpospora phusangensis]GIH24425.1 hypothetical protein Aph01nite_27350 [Acrocarpospora phusangensis]